MRTPFYHIYEAPKYTHAHTRAHAPTRTRTTTQMPAPTADITNINKQKRTNIQCINGNFWQSISVFMFQGECMVNLNNLFSKPSTPILIWTNPRQSFLGNYDYASHFTYDNSSVSVRFHFLVCCSITFLCIVVYSRHNMLLIQGQCAHGWIMFCYWFLSGECSALGTRL